MRIKYSLQTKPTQNISASTTYLYVLLTEPNALIVWISAEEYEYSAFKVDTQVNLQGSLPPYNCSYLLYKNKYWVGRPIYDIPETIKSIVDWEKAHLTSIKNTAEFSLKQVNDYLDKLYN